MHSSQRSRLFRPHLLGFAFLLAGTLFPIGWLATVNQFAAAIDATVFATDLSHAIAHGLLFLAVGLGALRAFPALRTNPWYFLLLMLLICVGQEAFQLGYKQRPLGFDEYRDVATDAVGFMVAFAIMRRPKRQAAAHVL